MSSTTLDALNVKAVLTFLADNATRDVACDFVMEFKNYFDDIEEGHCLSEGERTLVTDGLCLFCDEQVLTDYIVTFQFTVTVRAADEDAASEHALNAVSAHVDENDNVTNNYDLDVYATDPS